MSYQKRKLANIIENKNETTFVYTVSDCRDMIKEVVNSLKSLEKWVEKKNIHIFYTPPRSQRNYLKLSKYAVVNKVTNVTDQYLFSQRAGAFRCGEKIHLCDLDCPNVIYLDADTIIKKNLLLLINEDYDFSGRVGSAFNSKYFDMKSWNRMFKYYKKTPIPMINAGFMIFRNYTHHKIKNELEKYLKEDFPQCHLLEYHKDMYAFSLALSGYNIKWMSNKEHAFRWMNEDCVDTFVLHGRKSIMRGIKKRISKLNVRVNAVFKI